MANTFSLLWTLDPAQAALGKQTAKLFAGEDARFVFTHQGGPLSIAGDSHRLIIARDPQYFPDAAPLVDLDNTAKDVVNESAGTLAYDVADALTADWPSDTYYLALLRVNAGARQVISFAYLKFTGDPSANGPAAEIDSALLAALADLGTPDADKLLGWDADTGAPIWRDSGAAFDGNYASLTNIPSSFTPSAHASSHKHGGTDEVATATAAANAIPKAGAGGTLAIGWLPIGTSAATACAGNDSRLSDARTPTAHASAHAAAGSDPLTLAQSQITNLTSDLAAKAPLASPPFTGTPTAPTATGGTNTTQIATTAFVAAAVAGVTSISGNAATATALQTARTINGVSFDGTASITVTAAAGTLTGSTLASGVTASSLTSVGTIGTGVWQGTAIAAAYIDTAIARLASPTFTGTPAAPTATGGTNTTQIATTAFVQAAVSAAVAGLLEMQGNLDCSANPNYPAASKGDVYYVSAAGKIGGASGQTVAVGDAVIAKADNAGGTEASVGASWFILEKNLNGALLSANNLSDVASAATSRSNLGLGSVENTALSTWSGTSSITTVGALTAGSTGAGFTVALGSSTITGQLATANGGTGVDNSTGGTANTFWARPNGATGAATYRAIAAADIPTLNQNTTGSAATLTTARSIYGNSFNGSADLTQTIASNYGGTGNGFTKFTGPTTSEKTFALPNASATILTDNAAVTVAQGGTGRATGTTAYGLIAAGTTATGAQQTLAAGATTDILVGGGASALPVWTTATGSGAPVRATSPTLVTPLLGTPTSGTLTNCTGLPVAGGGTGLASTTAYAVLCGGTTTTGALQPIASVGTAGQVLTSNGAGALPTFQAAAGGGLTYTASKTGAYNAAAGDLVRCDTTSAAFTVTLPASPASGDEIGVILQTKGTGNALTIGRNAKNIDGAAADYILYTAGDLVRLKYDGTGWWIVERKVTPPYVLARMVRSNNTDNGTATSGSWGTLPLSEITTDASGIASISSNAVTLPAGTYTFEASNQFYLVNRVQIRLYNQTDSSVIRYGQTGYSNTTDDTAVATVSGQFTITASKAIRVEYRVQTTKATTGLGVANNFSGEEVYTLLEFWRQP